MSYDFFEWIEGMTKSTVYTIWPQEEWIYRNKKNEAFHFMYQKLIDSPHKFWMRLDNENRSLLLGYYKKNVYNNES
jgi:hypothetical protein